MPKKKAGKSKPKYGEGGKGADECRKLSIPLRKRVLAIDPSSGSAGSKPGFALFVEGGLEFSGTFNEINCQVPFFKKMRQIACHMKVFGEVDVLVIENIPPFMAAGGTSFRTAGVVNLHKSIGAIEAGVDAKECVEINPNSWHKFVNERPFLFAPSKEYVKSDEKDAIVMGLFALFHGGVISDEDMRNKYGGILHE